MTHLSIPKNMPTLYINIMDGLPSDFARDVFLWAVERTGEDRYCYRAEAFARETDQILSSVSGLLDLQAKTAFKNGGTLLDDEQRADLEDFFATRHANYRYGGNMKPPYATQAA